MSHTRVVVFDLLGNVKFVSGVRDAKEIESIWSIVQEVDPKLIDGVPMKISRDGLEIIVKMDRDLIGVLWYEEK